MLLVDRQAEQRAGGGYAQQFIKPVGTNMPVGEGAGTDDTGIGVVGHRQAFEDIALDQVAVDLFFRGDIQHLL